MNVETLLADGASALSEGRWAQARSAFEAVLACEPRPERRPEALNGLGEALWWLGDPLRSNEFREQAYAGFRRAGDSARAVLAALGIAITYDSNFGNNQAAMGWIARAGRLVHGKGDPLAAWVRAMRAYLTADVPTSITLYQQSLAAARSQGDVDLELSCLSGLGERLVMSGEVEAGMSLIDEAMAGTLGGEYTRMETVVYTSCDMLIACDIAHDLERAARWCEVANRFIDTFGCPFLHARCRTIYGGLLVHTGRWADAERELAVAIDLSVGAGPHVAADAFARMADLRLRQGRIEDASSLLFGHEDQSRALLAAAAVRLARGDPAGAVTVLQRRLAQSSNRLGSAPALELLVRASLRLGEVATARDAAGALALLAAEGRSTYAEALAAVAAGHLSLAQHDIDEGCAQLETALHIFIALGMPYEAAQARLEVARARAASQPDAAAAEGEAAFTTFDRIGARSDADAAAAFLRSLGVPYASARRRTGELTDREQQVLNLIALGLSNPEIAARLHISRKTAAHHVSNVLSKLGVRNRTEAAAHLRVTT